MEQSGSSRTGRAFAGYLCDNYIGQFRITTLVLDRGEKEMKYQSTPMFVMMSVEFGDKNFTLPFFKIKERKNCAYILFYFIYERCS